MKTTRPYGRALKRGLVAVAGVAVLGGAGTAVATIVYCKPTTLSATVTAKASWDSGATWDVTKSVSDPSVDLFRGDSKTVTYTVGAVKTPGTESATISGQVCVTNGGAGDTQALAINAKLSMPPSSTAIKTVTVDLSAAPVIVAGGSHCYAYSIAVPSASVAGGATYKVTANVTITNHAGHVGYAFGPSPSDTTVMPAAPTGSSIYVDDSNEMSWKFTATGTEKYTKTFSCDADEGTYHNVATIRGTQKSASADVNVTCNALQVTKTAKTSFDKTWTWTIAKSADTTGITGLAAGATAPINWTVTAGASSAESNYKVSGDITVHNGTALGAELAGVTDVMTGIESPVAVNCGVEFPYVLPARTDLVCTYSSSLPNKDSRVNTATATLVNHDYPAGDVAFVDAKTTPFSGQANVDFAEATVTEIDKTAAVSDTLKGALGTLTAGVDTLPATFTYSTTAGPLACGTSTTVDNTASFLTNDTKTTGSASAGVPVSAANCVPPPVTPPAVVPPAVVDNAGTPAVKKGKLAVRKTGPRAAVAGQLVTYTITVRNTGRAAAKSVVLKDILPGGYALARKVKGASLSKGALAWKIGTLKAGASKTVRASFRIDRSISGRRCNVAAASASGLAGARATACTRIAAVAGALEPAVTG